MISRRIFTKLCEVKDWQPIIANGGMIDFTAKKAYAYLTFKGHDEYKLRVPFAKASQILDEILAQIQPPV